MAKKKEKEDGAEPKKKNTDSNILEAQKILDNPKMVVSISPAVDLALGGGLQEGTWTIISGPQKCGKTTTILHMCAKIQQAKPKSIVYYFDVENRLQARGINMPGLDLERFKVIRSVKGNHLTAEDYLTRIEETVRNQPDCVIVVDSISALCSADIDQADYYSNPMTTKANILVARLVKKCAGIVPVNDIFFIAVNQMMANPSGYGAGMKEKTVTALEYQADNKLKCTKTELVEAKGKILGQTIKWKLMATCLPNALTNSEFDSVIYYGYGIHEELELLRIAIDLGVVNKDGSWYSYDTGLKDEKNEPILKRWQGENNTLLAMQEDKDLTAAIRKEVEEML